MSGNPARHWLRSESHVTGKHLCTFTKVFWTWHRTRQDTCSQWQWFEIQRHLRKHKSSFPFDRFILLAEISPLPTITYYCKIKGTAQVYLFIIARQPLVIRLCRLLQSLVFCRLPHGGVLRPSRYLFGCYVSSNSCCSSPVSNPHTQSVNQLASTSMQEDKCDILGGVHGAA